TVLPRYAAWFKRFPDISILASASLDDVLKAWEGLGYYRRARFIHTTAQQMMTEHDGKFPRTYDDILKFPGIGRSTAGAIASFCFGANTPVLDGNVKRVLKRWRGATGASENQLWQWAQQALDASANPSGWNQAMMDLGATVCSPRVPDCVACPVSAYCAVAFQGGASVRKKKSTSVRDVHWQVSIHVHPKDGIWFTRRPCSGIWAGLWTPPIDELVGRSDISPCYIHLLTHRRLHLYGMVLNAAPTGKGRWVSDIKQLAIPTGIHRLLAKHGLC
ncbi:MAG: NUDIX domain-containing protein, partial [Mariprofundaceae bacterium]|nr:NUDIX domain-containing protein [Mariprofundaceae bacterium]